MATLVSDIVRYAMLKSGVIRKNETAASDETADALAELNIMVSSWSARRLMSGAAVPENFSLTYNVAAYLIGAGQTWNTVKPSRIVGAFVRDSSNVDSPCDIITLDTYDSLRDKATLVGRPSRVMYNPGIAQQATQIGTVTVYPIPNNTGGITYKLYISSTKPFTAFAALGDTVTYDEVYIEAMIYELAIRLWREYHSIEVPVPADILRVADSAMLAIENLNADRIGPYKARDRQVTRDVEEVRGATRMKKVPNMMGQGETP